MIAIKSNVFSGSAEDVFQNLPALNDNGLHYMDTWIEMNLSKFHYLYWISLYLYQNKKCIYSTQYKNLLWKQKCRKSPPEPTTGFPLTFSGSSHSAASIMIWYSNAVFIINTLWRFSLEIRPSHYDNQPDNISISIPTKYNGGGGWGVGGLEITFSSFGRKLVLGVALLFFWRISAVQIHTPHKIRICKKISILTPQVRRTTRNYENHATFETEGRLRPQILMIFRCASIS